MILLFWPNLRHEVVEAHIVSGIFTFIMFFAQSALLYSRFERRRKEEHTHMEIELRGKYDKEFEEYRRELDKMSQYDKDRQSRMDLLLNAAKSATLGAEDLSTTASLRAEQHNLRLSRTTSALQKFAEFLREAESLGPLKPSDSEKIKAFQSAVIEMISALDFDKYGDSNYENELTTRYESVEASYAGLKTYTQNLANSMPIQLDGRSGNLPGHAKAVSINGGGN